MTIIDEDQCRIMYSENIPYTRIDMSGLLQPEQVKERLSSPKLFKLLAKEKVQNVLLNLSQSWRVGTEDLEWIEQTWLNDLARVGVRKVSVVTASQVHEMLINIFQSISEGTDKEQMEVRFFDENQFSNGWAAVSWF